MLMYQQKEKEKLRGWRGGLGNVSNFRFLWAGFEEPLRRESEKLANKNAINNKETYIKIRRRENKFSSPVTPQEKKKH